MLCPTAMCACPSLCQTRLIHVVVGEQSASVFLWKAHGADGSVLFGNDLVRSKDRATSLSDGGIVEVVD